MKPAAALSLTLCLVASSAAALAQPIYRCGTAYSHLPCSTARLVVADDARSAAQRLEADRVVNNDRRLAADMRRDRLADEATRKPTTASSLSGLAAHPAVAAPPSRAKPMKKRKASSKASATKDFVARGTVYRTGRASK